ncbi:MAG: hypothetical protein WC217_02390 [Candidatus Paceibacterota bacterium]|jgi:hypothetical protein
MKSTSYTVEVGPFAERHFIKSFAKKYKGAWSITLETIQEEFKQVDLLFLRNIAEIIVDGKVKICKTEFKVAGTKESRHSSGNRCIIAIHSGQNEVRVLLVYAKTDLSGKNETAEWQKLVKDNYPQYKNLF